MRRAKIAPRDLQPGDYATTDYEIGYANAGPLKTVRIVERTEGKSQTGVLYRVTPPLRGNSADGWFDAAWFERVEALAPKESSDD